MTKKELETIINDSLKANDFDFNNYDWEDIERVLNDIQENKKTILYFDTVCYEGHPTAIQVFTKILKKDRNYRKLYKVYHLITNFEMVLPKDPKDFLEILWEEHKTALRMQKEF